MKLLHMDPGTQRMQHTLRWHLWWLALTLFAVAAAVMDVFGEPGTNLRPEAALAVLVSFIAIEAALILHYGNAAILIAVAVVCIMLTPAAAPISMVLTAYFAATASRTRRVWYTAQIAGTPLVAVGAQYLLHTRGSFVTEFLVPFLALTVCAIIALVSCNMPSRRTVRLAPLSSAERPRGAGVGSALSRQIHDRIGHELTLAHLEAQRIALGAVEDDEIRTSAESASRRIDAAMREMYAIIDELIAQRPELGELVEEEAVEAAQDDSDHDCRAGVSERADAFRAFMVKMADEGVRIDLRLSPDVQELDLPALDMALSVVQEGVVNAVRHGGPGEIVVSASYLHGDPEIELVVRSPLPQRHRAVLGGSKHTGHGLAGLERELAIDGGSIERVAYGETYVLLARVPVTFGLKPQLARGRTELAVGAPGAGRAA